MNCVSNVPSAEYKARRKNMGITLEEFASRVGVSALTLRRWEEGRTRPTKENHQLWVSALDEAEEAEWQRPEAQAK